MGQVEAFMQEWLRHRRVLEELLQPIKTEHMDFKPWDNAMTLSELTLHVAYWSKAFVTLVKTGVNDFAKLVAEEPRASVYQTMDEIRQTVSQWTEETKQAFSTLRPEDLEVVNVSQHPNFRGPRKLFLQMMRDHEIHHKGQLFIYARMVGVKEVPFFIRL
ncbi:hypothetical protein GCM10011391_10170 [Pullulanibacillus camelliae]|uniref:Damage-inducible protein DinB n=1 Tax=Pullulanibacillus camelliae TaxID=1707096 RepID=A0A8J2YG44_9BACL|nr:DinB family protein [Pullulanibacillus camelliae]GGE33473.1 hypothetical protein GCM10011391_10170 [Pullulanibacillus camelliae]